MQDNWLLYEHIGAKLFEMVLYCNDRFYVFPIGTQHPELN